MATKSYKLLLDLRSWVGEPIDRDRFTSRSEEVLRTQQWLNDTLRAFNTGVDYLTGWLLRMHRGAGVWREKRDGIWREWQEITTFKNLDEVRSRHKADPGSSALLENHELLAAFRNKGKSESEAVELAECCRRIAKELCPPSEDSSGAQMPRDELDLLTLDTSTAKGIRERGIAKSGEEKKQSGRKPQWQFKEALSSLSEDAGSLGILKDKCRKHPLWQAKSDRRKFTKSVFKSLKKQGSFPDWKSIRDAIAALCADWQKQRDKAAEKKQQSAVSGAISAYRNLLDAGCLPLPGLDRPATQLQVKDGLAEWNYAMWNMAGQRVRSHLGWVRRRATERLLWELRTRLFERGGWIRTMRDGRPIRKDGLTPDDIRFENPPHDVGADFDYRPAYDNRAWVKTFRSYETDEMPKHREGVAFGAAEQPRIRKRTAKGWAKVRDKWIDLIAKARTADDLLEAFDQMRTRKTRDFGDRRLFGWLASPERRWLYDGTDKGEDNNCGREDRDCLTAFITHNEHLADQPKSITWTQVDAVKHPVWPFFGENSAVEYWLTREKTPSGDARLVLVLKQLLARQADGSYSAVNRVKIALRGYEDFETSFALPCDATDVSAKQELVFHDDLLCRQTRQGTLSGMKLTWDRGELEASHRKRTPTKKPPRIYANFSCDTGEAALPEWLTRHVGSDVKLKKPRDGMTRAFFLNKSISKGGATEDGGSRLPPGQRKWPREAIDHGFTVRGTDLGYRTSSAGAYWRLSFTQPDGKTAWQVGTCADAPVYAVLERTSVVSLPGDGESLPTEEQALRERLYSLRTRLNLNNALLRVARLLALEAVTQQKLAGVKVRERSDGTTKRIGTKWKTETRALDEAEIKENCRKSAAQLARWASTEAMTESLKAIGHEGLIWDWLASRDASLKALAENVPTTEVPTEKQAKKQGVDRDAVRAKRKEEDDALAKEVYRLRKPLAGALCSGHDAEKHSPPAFGLWFEFDAALMRELSYSDRGRLARERALFESGLFRLLRKPPVTKHQDRKDDVNNLPHGRSHRGGLAMSRLNFLDDVKNFIRRWSCRPRWPGDVRRISEDTKFARSDTEHLDNLREHRAKLIAHADVAQALGFEQDLRRGLWRFRTPSGELLWHRPERGRFYREEGHSLVQCAASTEIPGADALHPHRAFDQSHVLVYEDLTRYKMSSDRPKRENAGLARWSHRRILAFAQHIGGLFGMPITTVDARFSSRYCSHCGAPGCRADRFDPEWLSQGWLQRILQSNDIRDADMKSVADRVRAGIAENPNAFRREADRPWVLRDGGTHFVCANRNCTLNKKPINADENAAANIGLRFLRGIDGLRVGIGASGKVTKSIGHVPPGLVLERSAESRLRQGEPYWMKREDGDPITGSAKRRRKLPSVPDSEVSEDEDDDTAGAHYLFRDPSGTFLLADRWYEGKYFWGGVARECAIGIKAENASRFATGED